MHGDLVESNQELTNDETCNCSCMFVAEAAWFDMEHARWQEEHGKMMRHLRAALEAAEQQQQHAAAPAPAEAEAQLRQLVDAAAAHHGVLAELKAVVARADAFHLVSGAWASAAERCFLWIGGFRPSELIKVIPDRSSSNNFFNCHCHAVSHFISN